MKKWTKFLILPALILCSLFSLFACGKTQDGIKIHSEFKTVYYVGEELDLTGGIIDYTSEGNTVQVVISEEMVSGFST